MSLRIEITKHADGSGVLRCTRADGSVTWQKRDRHAAHFAFHDLTHFAVETTLGFRQGFFGLIAQGWDIDDTTGKGQRGRLPEEAVAVEHLVGLLDVERASGEFAEAEVDLTAARALRGQLFTRWKAVPPGGKIDLEFPGTGPTRRA